MFMLNFVVLKSILRCKNAIGRGRSNGNGILKEKSVSGCRYNVTHDS